MQTNQTTVFFRNFAIDALYNCVHRLYLTFIFSQHVIFLWSTNINSSGYYIVSDIIYRFLSNFDVTLMLSMSVFSKILLTNIFSTKSPVCASVCAPSVHMYLSFKLN